MGVRASAKDRERPRPGGRDGVTPKPHPSGRSSSCAARDLLRVCYFLDKRRDQEKAPDEPGLRDEGGISSPRGLDA
jgi:hypothetical protein